MHVTYFNKEEGRREMVLLQPLLAQEPSWLTPFLTPPHLATAPRTNPLSSTGSHSTFSWDTTLLMEVVSVLLNLLGISLLLYHILIRGHDRCVLIWALAGSWHPDFNGAEQVHMPLSNPLRSFNQADLCNEKIHISYWTCKPAFRKMEMHACGVAHTSQVRGGEERRHN